MVGEPKVTVVLEEFIEQCDLSRRYHARLSTHYSRLEKLSICLVLLAGSASFSPLVETYQNWFGPLVVFFSTLALVFDVSGKARTHTVLARDYSMLRAELEDDLDTGSLTEGRIKSKYSLLEALEPPIKPYLVLLCQGEIQRAKGKPIPPAYQIGWIMKLLCYWVHWEIKDSAPK